MHLIYHVFYVLAGIIWGNWKNWRKYYSTILFFIICDMFANLVTYHYPLWHYHETLLPSSVLDSHLIISLTIMLFQYPAVTLIYLGRFPAGIWKRILWISFWVLLLWLIEFINLHMLHIITHQNGWTMTWSLAFDIVLFITIWVHYNRPLIAWILAALWATTIIISFNFPLGLLP
jgi:hypothetical protein